MLSNDTKDNIEDILSVRTEYFSESLRFIKNFVSLCFWSKIKKNLRGAVFQIWGEKNLLILCFQMTEDNIEDILSVQTEYISESLRFIKNFMSLCYWSKIKTKSVMPTWVDFSRFGVDKILLIQTFVFKECDHARALTALLGLFLGARSTALLLDHYGVFYL